MESENVIKQYAEQPQHKQIILRAYEWQRLWEPVNQAFSIVHWSNAPFYKEQEHNFSIITRKSISRETRIEVHIRGVHNYQPIPRHDISDNQSIRAICAIVGVE